MGHSVTETNGVWITGYPGGTPDGRWGGAITAAYFLKEFTEDKPWVHLDIAGTAWLDEGKPWMAKGPSGVPMRTFVELALGWQS